jgi:hypothetical protein
MSELGLLGARRRRGLTPTSSSPGRATISGRAGVPRGGLDGAIDTLAGGTGTDRCDIGDGDSSSGCEILE